MSNDIVFSCNIFFNCRWVWSEAGKQSDLEEVLEIGGFGYPAMAVVNSKKMKYSILRGSFSEDGINEFLRCVFKILKSHNINKDTNSQA